MLVNHQVVAPGGGTIGGDWIAPLKAVHIDHAAELIRKFRAEVVPDWLKLHASAIPEGAASC